MNKTPQLIIPSVPQHVYLRIRRGSGLKGGTAIICPGPPIGGPDRIFLPDASYEDGPPCSRNICIATSGGAGTNGPRGLKKKICKL